MVIFEDALPEQDASRQLAKDLVSGEWWKEIAEKKMAFAPRSYCGAFLNGMYAGLLNHYTRGSSNMTGKWTI